MGFPVDDRLGLVLRFADFHLLPDLLKFVTGLTEAETIDVWAGFLDEADCNTDHIDEYGEESPARLAEDAYRMSKGLELVSNDALTDAGDEIAQLAAIPLITRSEQHDLVLQEVLADQIMSCYFNPSLSLAQLLQTGASHLANGQPCPGLFLVEVQALIELAHRKTDLAENWIDDVVSIREAAVGVYEGSNIDVDALEEVLGTDEAARFLDQIELADAVTEYSLEEMDLSHMTMTELRATAMLLTFSGFLELRDPIGPVQYLTIPSVP